MTETLDQLRDELLASVDQAADLAALEAVRVGALGKKGSVSQQMQGLGKLPPEDRKAAGQALNAVKTAVAEAIEAKKTDLETAALDARLAEESVDVSLPVRPEAQGRLHPITQTIDEAIAILGEMGFAVAEGPEIEDDFHNFTALNIPPEHPARQMHDTFYLPEKDDGSRLVLRTHTSPVQIRTMRSTEPPLRIIAPGRTYRCDSDMTHTPMFHQIEGLVIDKSTHFGHLKGCLLNFLSAFFEVDDLPLRFRPSFFPFTEPSAEVDIGCSRDGGELKIGGGEDWMEILGCGMVHPNVLKACEIDPEEYQGFAFGLGVERMAMLKYGIPDLRTFFDADLRWLKHYGFVPLEAPSLVRGLS
ncbi:MAG TPA: phenylalanine--tRNA ligase subunit alpha [Rhodospirillaceae bacterium]|nr:phenylalanine--tRNA ligase subunit alpha [Rhodospirillaceae bacterium]HAT35479.1 phenylalanine--tRNA ligase subunit alpha [Rhodospirillaceae bacterium]